MIGSFLVDFLMYCVDILFEIEQRFEMFEEKRKDRHKGCLGEDSTYQ